MKASNQLIIVPLLLTVLPAEANVIFTSATGVPATASVGTDLFQTSLTSTTWPTASNINNGTTGAFNEASVTNPANPMASGSYTFVLDVTTNPLGYDITSINSFSGWTDNRAGQSYTIYFSTVANPLVFNQITPGGTGNDAVSVAADNTSLVTSVSDDTSAPLGTGVHSIRFDVGVNGNGNVWREIDAIGVATPSGADGTWNGISGNWTDTTISGGVWSGGIIAAGSNSTAFFTGTDIATDQSIALDGNRTIGNITFTDATTSSNNLAITDNILTLDRTNLDIPVIDVTQSDRTLTIGSVVAGIDGLQKNGAGNLTLTGANTITGTTTINGGTLQIGNGGALYSPTVSGTGNLTFGSASAIVNNGALVYNIDGGSVNVNQTISGTGTVSVTGNQAVNFAAGTTINTTGSQTYSATANGNRYYGFTLTDDATVALTSSAGNISMTGMLGTANGSTGNLNIDTSAGNGNVTLNVAVGQGGINYGLNSLNVNAGTGTIALGDFNSRSWDTALNTISLSGGAVNSTVNMTAFGTLTVTNSSVSLFSGTLSGSGALTKAGAGTLTLSNTNSYSGDTTVSGGTLTLASANANNQTSTVTIAASGAKLQLSSGATDSVAKLFIGATQRVIGEYGHTDSGATNGGAGVGAMDAYFAAGTGKLNVTSGPPVAGYTAWQTANGTSQTFDLDHDNDGVPNGVEFFLGGTTDTTGFTTPLPGVEKALDGTLSVTWTKAATYPGTAVYGTEYVVETSETLTGTWTLETVGGNITESGNDVKYTFPSPLGTKKFARLKVTDP